MQKKQEKRIKKICFAASSGGHLEEILGLDALGEKYDSILITEKTKYQLNVWQKNIYYMKQINRREKLMILHLITIFIRSISLLIKENPDMIVSTGALMTVPVCIAGKLLGKKIVFIESIARVKSPSATGKLLYKFSDLFIVQWEQLLEIYPKAVYGGRII